MKKEKKDNMKKNKKRAELRNYRKKHTHTEE